MSHKQQLNAGQLDSLTCGQLARAIAMAAIEEVVLRLPPHLRESCLIEASTMMLGAQLSAADAPDQD